MGLRTDISWFTPQSIDATGLSWRSHGYTEVSLNLFQSLRDRGQRVLWNATGTKWHVNYCLPYFYHFDVPKVVGYTPWEYTAIPPAWVYQFNQCEQVWTTSQWCKEILEQYNLDPPVHVLAHGISSEWTVEEREIGDKFYFLHVGGESIRKNVQMVITAFLDCFDGNEDYQLILKVSEGIEDIYLQPSLEELERHPQITILNGFIPKDSLVSLYKNSHCMVYPTAGEGFGMIPFQAIATGMPTICTELSGCSQFAEMSMPLKATWGDVPEREIEHHNLVGTGAQMAIPDYEDLCRLMKNIGNEYYTEKAKAMRSARIIHKYETWDVVADELLDFLEIS